MLFRPVLARATLRDRIVASVGALLGITATYLLCAAAPWADPRLPFLVAPMGASAVLVFAVPASPLAQPWAVVGGNIVSVLVGVAVLRLVPHPALAAGAAVGGAILAMSLLRCLHPPGGAAALTVVLGGAPVAAAGYGFAVMPVGLDAAVLTLCGWLFHHLSGHSYPHRAAPRPELAPAIATPLHRADIDGALADLGETFDVSREDLDLLLHRAELRAATRRARDGGVR